MTVRFQRANFLVSDMGRARAFYCDVLGFELAFEKPPRETSYSHEIFEIEAGPIGFAALSAPHQPRVMALTVVPGLVRQPLPRRATIVLDVDDFDGVIERAKAGGFEVYDEQRLVTHDGRIGREAGVVDGDGNVAVIYCIVQPAPGGAG